MHASRNNELERRTEKPIREKIKTSREQKVENLLLVLGPKANMIQSQFKIRTP